MADLERADPRLLAILRLQRGDRAAAVTGQAAQFVERRVEAVGDIAAIIGLGRRARHQCARQRIDQRAMPVERRQQLRQQQRLIGQPAQPLAQQSRFAQAVAQLAQVTRTAPPHGDTAERAADIGQRAQRRTQLTAQCRVIMEQLDQAQPRVDQRRIHQRRRQILC